MKHKSDYYVADLADTADDAVQQIVGEKPAVKKAWNRPTIDKIIAVNQTGGGVKKALVENVAYTTS